MSAGPAPLDALGLSALAEAKAAARAAIDRDSGRLIALADELHAHPETAWHEDRAVRACARAAVGTGLAVVQPAFGLTTSFSGTAGSIGPLVTICCEYDALPGLGHACGHNLIAAAGVGAARALAQLAGPLTGRLQVVGCPAEEAGGGKVMVAQRNGFAGSAAVLMVHPATFDAAQPRLHAAQQLDVVCRGRAAHAALAPDRGINALDALVLGYQALAALRGRLTPDDKIHGILTTGGEAPNVVPDLAAGAFVLRTASHRRIRSLAAEVASCFGAGGAATGARVDLRWKWPVYLPFLPNGPLVAALDANLRELGRRPIPLADIPRHVAGSTDLGNISHLVPCGHPFLAVAPPDAPLHTAAFTAWAKGEAAGRAVLDGAKALAFTVIDLWCRPALRRALATAFRASASQRASVGVALGAVSPIAGTAEDW